jgi:hypothetical protein
MSLRFKVFGMLILVEKHADDWRPYYSSGDGKKRPADFLIPSDIGEDDLAQYLGDLFHEHARPNHAEVIKLD